MHFTQIMLRYYSSYVTVVLVSVTVILQLVALHAWNSIGNASVTILPLVWELKTMADRCSLQQEHSVLPMTHAVERKVG